MSQFYDLASLVVIPSGYKASTIYAQKPLTTDGQLSFSRASTATRVNASGLIEAVASNVPRLDYLGSTCPRLLLEPQRTNLLNYSEQFNSTPYWDLGSAATITANSVISPDGTLSADTLTANGAGQIYVRNNVYLGTAQTCSSSIFVKKANHSLVGFRNSGTTSAHDVFNFDTKTWTNNSGATLSYEEFGNGWFRLKSTNTDAVNLNYYWSVIPAVTTSGTENTTASNLSVYIWGGQAEQNASYCTSYIPTLGASVTRVADAASKTGISSLIGQTEGTIFAEINFDLGVMPPDNSRIQLSDGTTSNWIFIGMPDGASSNLIRIYVNAPSGSMSAYSTNPLVNGVNKIAYGYKSGSFVLYVNGVQAATSSTTLTMATCSRIDLQGDVPTASAKERTKYNQVLLFKTRLTNAQLAEITTL
jgi:hypothetical protein